jgi:hypothetical protein
MYQLARGESRIYTITVTSGGAAVDLTDAQIVFYVYDLLGAVVLEKRSLEAGGSEEEIEIPDQTGDEGALKGKLYLRLTPADTDLEQTARWSDCWVVTAADEPEQLLVDDHAPFMVTGQPAPSFV